MCSSDLSFLYFLLQSKASLPVEQIKCPFKVYPPKNLPQRSEWMPLYEIWCGVWISRVIAPLGRTWNHTRIDFDQPGRLFLVSFMQWFDSFENMAFSIFFTKFAFSCGWNVPIDWKNHLICNISFAAWVEQKFACQGFHIRVNYPVSAELLISIKG